MIKKILASFKKEWILFTHDFTGIMFLLLMPAVLITVMALIQDAPFKDYTEQKFQLLLVDNDGGQLSEEIITGLKKSQNFEIIQSIDDEKLDLVKLKSLLKAGQYKIGIEIPKGATAELVNTSNILANQISKQMGLSALLPSRENRENVYVRLFFDPTSKPTYKLSVTTGIEKLISATSGKMLFSRLEKMGGNSQAAQVSNEEQMKKLLYGIDVKEEYVGDTPKYKDHLINSVQHNVPAWAIFGIFFIIMPIVGNGLKEKEDGSALRLSLIPGAANAVTLGKIMFYIVICLIQFIIMMSIGIWGLPHLGLNRLYMGEHPFVLIPVVMCIAFTATAYGQFLGTVFKTHNQALPFAAISVVILSALGGIWVPMELLPEVMQKIANISPLNWSLRAVNDLFLRQQDFMGVLPELLVLIAFGLAFWLAGRWVQRYRGFG